MFAGGDLGCPRVANSFWAMIDKRGDGVRESLHTTQNESWRKGLAFYRTADTLIPLRPWTFSPQDGNLFQV